MTLDAENREALGIYAQRIMELENALRDVLVWADPYSGPGKGRTDSWLRARDVLHKTLEVKV